MNGTTGVDGGNDGGGAFQARIDTLLNLVTARARGEVPTATVEEAVAQLLSSTPGASSAASAAAAAAARGGGGGTSSASASTNATAAAAAAAPAPPSAASATGGGKLVVEDDDDYDNLEEDGPTTTTTADSTASASSANPGRDGRRGTKRPRSAAENDEDYVDDGDEIVIDKSKRYDELDAIPLGRVGAKMMVTFGDGRHPRPETVEAALMGARRLIQQAVRDARDLRRKHKAEYKKAQAAATLHTKRPRHIDKETVESLTETTVDSSMLFRAIGGYDRLSYDPKCGFDVPELEVLFPEEMMAYQRWKKMQKAYAQSKEDGGDGNDLDDDDDGDGDAEDDTDANGGDGAAMSGNDDIAKDEDEDEPIGGHLHRRLKQFDARTDQMKEKWYLSFSEVRQGSFIDKATGADGRMWREAQKKRKENKKEKRGRPAASKVTWESLPPSVVTFLHWIGFDITSAIPPPNEATANALAFLAYDFMGKIVEKSIFLRCLAQRDEARTSKSRGADGDIGGDGDEFLLELKGGEQLSVEDIEEALKDSAEVSVYFGPGFEDRLEMEMEEIVHKSKNKVSEEEKKIQQQEDELFAEMEKPPTRLEGVMDVLGEDHITDEMLKKRETSKAIQKVNALRASAKKEKTKKRGRGRPRKNK